MKTAKMLTILVLALVLMVCSADVGDEVSMGTVFTYQGRLNDAGSPADGQYDFQFSLYDDAEAGTQLGPTIAIDDLDVADGYFTVRLDFGTDVFTGGARWVGIGVRPGELEGSNEYTFLVPRQELTPSPYAIHAKTADEVTGAGMPRGAIVMWAGTLFEIPDGWALCDGTYGTPDLRDRFILSIGDGEYPGGTGGTHTYTLNESQLPSHGHTFTTNYPGSHYHTFTSNYAGTHTHTVPNNIDGSPDNMGDQNGSPNWGSDNENTVTTSAGNHRHTGNTNSSGNHGHSGTTYNTGGNQTIDNRPAYYKLAFIMKL